MAFPRPKKFLGQHFLTDTGAISRIVDAAHVSPGDGVLEIGPGRGALTRHLANKGAFILAVEYDHALADMLREEYATSRNVEIIDGDILSFDLKAALLARRKEPWKVVANLPYNISSQILFRFLEHRGLFSEFVLMFQREVGERLLAAPGSKEYGILSVFFQQYFACNKVLKLSPGAFYPPPKVDSVVIRLATLEKPRVEVTDEIMFNRIVRAAFATRRKTLWNCLKNMAGAGGEALRQWLQDCSIDPIRRGETLTLEEFACLAEKFSTVQKETDKPS